MSVCICVCVCVFFLRQMKFGPIYVVGYCIIQATRAPKRLKYVSTISLSFLVDFIYVDLAVLRSGCLRCILDLIGRPEHKGAPKTHDWLDPAVRLVCNLVSGGLVRHKLVQN